MTYLNYFKIPFIFFLIVYFLFLVVARAPAAWAVWGVHQASPSLWLSSPEGTLWNGKARSAQVDVGHTQIALGVVTWKLNPWTLLLLKPCVDFSASLPKQTLEGGACRAWSGRITLSEVNIDAPIKVVQAINPIEATGVISIQVETVTFDEKGYVSQLDARFSWQNARAFAVESWLNLGSFAATATEDGSGGISAKVFDLEGDYKVELDAGLAHGERDWNVLGTIAPNANAPSTVGEFLKIVGEDVGDGRYKVQWP